MWSNLRQSKSGSIFLHDVPNDLFCHTVAPRVPSPADTPEQFSVLDSGSRHPVINCALYPVWNGNSPDMARFSNQIDYCPMILSAL
jgi:hypothetical protein